MIFFDTNRGGRYCGAVVLRLRDRFTRAQGALFGLLDCGRIDDLRGTVELQFGLAAEPMSLERIAKPPL
jgi:hypothetical protein